MKPTIQLDTRLFNRVMQQYSEINRRTYPEIVNAKALDVSFRALKETPKADKAEIKALAEKPWWPKYIAKRIAGKGVVAFRKGASKIRIQGKGFTREEAKKISEKIIASRVRSIAFRKAGWLPAIRRLYPLCKDKQYARGTTGGARQYGVDKGSARPAVPGDNPFALIVNSAEGIDRYGGVEALQRAINGAAMDMAEYIARKLEGNARKVAR